MKKFLLILMFVFAAPVFALCPIGDGESVCTLPNTSTQGQISDMSINSPNTNALNRNVINSNGMNNGDDNIKSQFNTFKPTNLNNSLGNIQNQSGIQMNSSLGCQFGNCNKNANPDFLENQ